MYIASKERPCHNGNTAVADSPDLCCRRCRPDCGIILEIRLNLREYRTAVFFILTTGNHTVRSGKCYGPRSPGVQRLISRDSEKMNLGKYRDELISTTKAGYEMWDGHLWKLGAA